MKKIAIILLAFLISLCLISCTDQKNQDETGGKAPMYSGTPTSDDTGDKEGMNSTFEAPETLSPEPQTAPDTQNEGMPLLPDDDDALGDDAPLTTPSDNAFPEGGNSFNEGTFSEHSFQN